MKHCPTNKAADYHLIFCPDHDHKQSELEGQSQIIMGVETPVDDWDEEEHGEKMIRLLTIRNEELRDAVDISPLMLSFDEENELLPWHRIQIKKLSVPL